MNKRLKNVLIAIAMTAITTSAAGTACASGDQPAWLSGADLRQVPVRGSGPEADPYFQHRPATKQAVAEQWLAGVNLRRVTVRGPGPEADPYLQHMPAR
jgi:hypothetical protein